jgi:hypothetical protein
VPDGRLRRRLAKLEAALEADDRDPSTTQGACFHVEYTLTLPWQGWQGSAFARVRSRSLARRETSANSRFERTGAHGRERSLAFAMQKVVGSSPIIRF